MQKLTTQSLKAAHEVTASSEAKATPKARPAFQQQRQYGNRPATAGPPQQLQLKKVGDDWKIDASALMNGEIPNDEQLQAIGNIAGAAEAVAKEIEEGKYDTYEAAKAAYQQRMFAAMMQAMPQEQQLPMPQDAE